MGNICSSNLDLATFKPIPPNFRDLYAPITMQPVQKVLMTPENGEQKGVVLGHKLLTLAVIL